MANAMSDYLEAKLLDHVFRSVSYVPPTNVYLSLLTVATTDAGTGGTEVVGGSYARQIVTFTAAVSPDGKISNASAITFANMPACTIVGGATHDAVTAGNMLMQGLLASPRVVAATDNLVIAIGDFNLYFN